MKKTTLYLKKNGYYQNNKHPNYRHEYVLKESLHLPEGTRISLAGWFDHQMQNLTIVVKEAELDRKTE